RDVKNFQREITDLRDQLKIALDALNQMDAIRSGFLENAARQRVQLEALTNDQERMNVKLQSAQTKTMELTRENNKLQEQIRVLQVARNQPAESADRIWKAMDTLNGHLQKLEAEHLVLAQTAESSNKIADEAAAAVKKGKIELGELRTKNEELEQHVLDLKAKIVSVQSMEHEAVENEGDIGRKYEDRLKTLTGELERERESNKKLKNDISALLTLQDCLTKQLEEAVKHYDVHRKQTEDGEDKPLESA
ncbi:nucleoprotein TPR-like, partial [Topomyia yanbarensis]